MVLADGIKSPAWLTAVVLALIVALIAALYLPFLGNPLIFDDRIFFFGSGFSNYARFPIGLGIAPSAVFLPRLDARRFRQYWRASPS